MMEDYIEYDGNKYITVDSINFNNKEYVFLVNVDDQKDFFVRKLNETNSSLDPLDNEEEFNSVLQEFTNKHKDFISDLN